MWFSYLLIGIIISLPSSSECSFPSSLVCRDCSKANKHYYKCDKYLMSHLGSYNALLKGDVKTIKFKACSHASYPYSKYEKRSIQVCSKPSRTRYIGYVT